LKVIGQRHTNERGYVSVRDPSHPLAKQRGGRVMEHRKVLYDAIGEGPHPCYWCAVILEWKDIVVDHVNEDKADNRRTNLVVSCNNCNRARGAMLPFLARLADEAVPTFLCAALAYRASANSLQNQHLQASPAVSSAEDGADVSAFEDTVGGCPKKATDAAAGPGGPQDCSVYGFGDT
jgi:hypothetical protein